MVALLALAPVVLSTSAAASGSGPGISKVLVIMDENKSSPDVFPSAGNPTPTMPYLWSLAQQYGYATNWSDTDSPSQPNYLAIFGGSDEGDPHDCSPGPGCQWSGPTVFSQAIAEGGTAKTYAEDMTANCQVTQPGYYDVNHNPWVYFNDPTDASECAADDVPAGTTTSGAMLNDVQAGTLPTVGLLKPNLLDDTTDGTFAAADNWLQSWIQTIQAGPDWQAGRLAIVVTFDEGDHHNGAAGENVPFVMIAPGVSGVVVSNALNHYALTRFLDEVAGASPLGNASSQPDIAPLFGLTLNAPTTQVIAYSGPGNGAVDGTDTLTATGGGSGNPVVFSVDPASDPGVCAVSGANGSTVSYTGAGNCVIDANQAGGNGFSPAAQVTETIAVSANPTQTVNFTAPASGVVGGTAPLVATGGQSGNPVVFSVDPSSGSGVCALSGTNGSTVVYTGAGNCVIDANQAGGNGFTAASQVTGTITVSPSSHTVWVVDNTSSACLDSGPGTSAQPLCTIGAGASDAQPGDTVLVRAGTYTGTAVAPANSSVSFVAGAGVTISGGSSAFAISNLNNIAISGFTISGTSSAAISVTGGSNITISGNTESLAGTPVTATAAGISLNNVAGGLISDNVTHDNSSHGIYLFGTTSGVLVQGNTSYHNATQNVRNANGVNDIAPGNSIVGNVTYGNEDSGINVYPGADNTLVANNVTYDNGDHGIDDLNVTGGRVIGNTVYYNCTDGINVEGTSGNYLVENNIAVDNATGAVINPTPIATDPSTGQPYYTNTCNRRRGNIGIYDSAPTSTTADYNLVYQTNSSSPEYIWAGTTYSSQQTLNAATGQEAHGIFADPDFANAGNWNLQLTAASPAIDSADSLASGEQATDILGNPRVDDTAVANTGNPSGSFVDRGAYEYQGPFTVINASSVNVATTAGVAVPVTLQGKDSAACELTFTIVSGPANGTVGPISNQPCTPGNPNTDTATLTYAPKAGFSGTDAFTYRVSDGTSQSAPATVTVTVANAKPPVASLSVAPSSGSSPLVVTANASKSTVGTNPIASYTFAWGDGSTTGPQAGSSATHTYTAAGVDTVKVTVTDTAGLTSSATATVNVNASGTNLVGNPGFETGLSGWNTSGSGTGVTLTQVAGGHGGNYAGLLTNTSSVNAGCTLNDSPNWVGSTSPGTYTGSIWVRADTAGKQFNLRFREYTSSTGTLINSATKTVTLSTAWQQVTVSYTVATAGTTLDFNAYTTTANSPPGTCFYADDASIVFGTPSSAPVAALAVSPSSGQAPLAVTADASGSVPGSAPISTYTFVWGDGTTTGPQAGATAGHTYTAPGTYTATVNVTDTAGLTSTATATVTVGSGPPTAALAVSPASGAAPVAVAADASGSIQGSSPIATYTFAWGDGTTTGPQTGATASHTYATAGTYPVTVTVTDQDGSTAQATQQVTVVTLPPSAALTVSPTSGLAPLLVNADASGSTAGSTAIASYSFAWGDGTTTGSQASATASHTYSSAGIYTVTVTVTDHDGSSAQATQQVSVSSPTAPTAALSVAPSSGTAPLPVTADASGSTAGSTAIASYSFAWGDGTSTGPQAGATASHTYTAAGTYPVTVTVTDQDGATAQATQQVTVVVIPPTAALSVTPGSGTAPLPVSADASGSSAGSTAIASYGFAWGDGTSTGPQASATANHSYTAAGTYTVTVTVTDQDGSTAQATQQVTVAAPTPPAAALSVTPSSGTAPVPVSADASGSTAGSSPIASYSFAWGDGASTGPQTAPIAAHTYTSGGTYTVTVTVTDTDGTSAQATQQVVVAALPPTAALSVSPGTGTAPLPVTADASGSSAGSSPISTYTFAWGDGGSTGPQSSPTAGHTYTAAGSYTVKVTVTDADGTTASTTQQVSVAAPTPPTAALSVSPGSGQAPLPVTANASGSVAGSSPISTYTFAWGDGSANTGPQAGATAGHTYAAAGSYTVTVTVTDGSGSTSTATATVAVGGNYVGNPGFETGLTGWNTSGSGSGVTLAQTAGGHSGSFSALLSNTSGTRKTCLLNDNPNWVAKTAAGTYSAGLWVKGATAGARLNLRLSEYNGSTLVGSKTANVTLSTAWQQVTVNYAVQSPGSTLDLNAYVSNANPGNCFYADDASVLLSTPPTAALSVSPGSGQAPLPVTANASGSVAGSSPISTYTFAWGDGSANTGPQAGATAGHTYAAAGSYPVTVTVTDGSGLTATATTTVAVGGNYVGNPGFETGLTGWNTSGSGSGVTLAQAAGGHSGSFAALVSNTSRTRKTCLLNDNPNWVAKTAAGTYSAGLWVRGAAPGATLSLRLSEYNGSTLVGSKTASVTLSTAWQQINVSYTVQSPGSSLDFNAFVTNAATGACFYADDASITLG